MLLVVTAVAALSGPTGHSRRAAPLPARREGQLSRMQNVEGWRGNNGRWRKYEEIKECAAGRRSYVPVGDFFNLETPDPIMDSTLGVRILFAIIVGTLVSFNSLAADYNRPFRGAFKIESETVTASLRQLRETLSPYGAVWKYCLDLREPPRHRADAVTATTSRRWRGAPEI